jgi:large subunit ribosomal protein L13
MKTIVPKIEPKDRKWYVVDLQGVILGRAAVEVADVLRGKNKTIFTPHIDCGDNIVAINASGLRFTGNKVTGKTYYHYSGYPGGLKRTALGKMMALKPEKVFTLAVRGMLPKGRLGRKQLTKLHVYAGTEHPHTAQKPAKLEL